jgi:hypothetical protein
VFTARDELSPYITQIGFVFKGLMVVFKNANQCLLKNDNLKARLLIGIYTRIYIYRER